MLEVMQLLQVGCHFLPAPCEVLSSVRSVFPGRGVETQIFLCDWVQSSLKLGVFLLASAFTSSL